MVEICPDKNEVASNNRLKVSGVPTGKSADAVVHEMLPGKLEAPANTPVGVKSVVVVVVPVKSIEEVLEAFISPMKGTRPVSVPCTNTSAIAPMLLPSPLILVLAA
jgi:hypothetical protein